MIGLLLRNWSWVALVVAVLAVPIAVTASFRAGEARRDTAAAERRLSDLDAEVNTPVTGLRAQLSSCTVDLGNATASLNRQNEAVDALKAEAEARDARAREAVSAAQNRARSAERRVQALLQSSPNEGETRCVAAERVIREQLG